MTRTMTIISVTWNLDEDELARFLAADTRACPYWRPGDDYITARKQ